MFKHGVVAVVFLVDGENWKEKGGHRSCSLGIWYHSQKYSDMYKREEMKKN